MILVNQTTKESTMKEKLIQQGDVLMKGIEKLPEGLKKVNHLTLALGEVTGHSHQVTSGEAEMYEKDGTFFLKVTSENAIVTHQEHAPVTLEEGTYEIDIVKEYSHFDEEARRVAD